MEAVITDEDRWDMLRSAVALVGRDELKAALAITSDPRFAVPKVAGNALNALRKHRNPVAVVNNPPYRAALPYVAAAVADDCLTRTIEVLGDHSDDPTREQLLEALDTVADSFSGVIIAVMLASVAAGDMPSSDLCFAVLDTDERFGLTERPRGQAPAEPHVATDREDRAPTPEQREARRLKKRKDAEERRRKMEASRKAAEEVRRARRQDRSERPTGADHRPVPTDASVARAAPRLTRRASLTPVEEEEFDRDDPWAAGVVFAWVPFGSEDADEADGKSRRCVVVAGSPTHLLVRPGYSEGGSKSRDWRSVPLRNWKQAGFDRPTWVDSGSLRVPRDEVQAPVGWLAPEDWNALW